MTRSGREIGPTVAVSRVRTDTSRDDYAEIIDLVHLPRGTRPTPIAYLDYEEVPRCRALDCEFYQKCLEFAARVRWRSFHCRQCPQSCEPSTSCSLARASNHEQGGGAVVIKFR